MSEKEYKKCDNYENCANRGRREEGEKENWMSISLTHWKHETDEKEQAALFLCEECGTKIVNMVNADMREYNA